MTNEKNNKATYYCIMQCSDKCRNNKGLLKSSDFYSTANTIFNNGKFHICKDCMKEFIYESNNINIEKLKLILRMLDIPFYQKSLDGALNDAKETIGVYMKNMQLSFKDKRWVDGDKEQLVEKNEIPNEPKKIEEEVQFELTEEAINSKRYVIDTLGYDPFYKEIEEDKRFLYLKLENYLDDSTLQDSFKIPIVIQIVKMFNQADKIDNAMAIYMSDPKNIVASSKSLNELVNSKRNITNAILSMAKDNGISVNHSNNKSKGAGTLSGIIKDLKEKDLNQASFNLFDIEMSQGMRQVADISNNSIWTQLGMDENDYTSMIKEQGKMIETLQSKLEKLEEENRLIKLKQAKENINEVGDNLDAVQCEEE